jgi:hypothetical protein
MNGTKGSSCQTKPKGNSAKKDLDFSYLAVSFQAKLEDDKL